VTLEPIAVTAAALRTALGNSRSEVLRRALDGERALANSAALEGAGTSDRTFAASGASNGADRAEDLLARALADALAEAGVESPDRLRDRRTHIVVGTTLHGMRHLREFLRGGPAKGAGLLTAGSVLSIAADRCGLRAAGVTISTACASGITAIGIACDLLRAGDADLVLAGGYDPVSEFSHAGFDSLRLLASDAPRPFAQDRDGMRTGEGAAILALERERDARTRGATVLARVAAVAESSDAFHLTQPHPDGDGAAAAIAEAISRGGDPDLIVAHATGTDANDLSEYRAYERAFDDRLSSIPVTAPKSALGHTLGAAGAVDAALCIAMAESGRIMPTMTRDCDLDRDSFPHLALVTKPMSCTLSRTLNLALGFGGSNAALLLDHRGAAPPGSHAARTPARSSVPRFEIPPDHESPADEILITGVSAIVPGACAAGESIADMPALVSGDVDDSLLAPLVDARAARRIACVSRLVRAAVRLAIDDASLPADLLTRVHAICATQHSAIGYSLDAYREVIEGGLGGGNPLLFAESVPNVPGAQCSLAFGIRGPAISVIGSRSAFVEALMIARARMIARGVERVIVVAAEERHPRLDEVLVAWRLAKNGDAMSAAGAVAFVLERADAARARGARSLAQLGAVSWLAPATRHWRRIVDAGRELLAASIGRVDAPARPGPLGRLERRMLGERLGETLGAELHAAGPALLAARRIARRESGTVLALDSFGAVALADFRALAAEAPHSRALQESRSR